MRRKKRRRKYVKFTSLFPWLWELSRINTSTKPNDEHWRGLLTPRSRYLTWKNSKWFDEEERRKRWIESIQINSLFLLFILRHENVEKIHLETRKSFFSDVFSLITNALLILSVEYWKDHFDLPKHDFNNCVRSFLLKDFLRVVKVVSHNSFI